MATLGLLSLLGFSRFRKMQNRTQGTACSSLTVGALLLTSFGCFTVSARADFILSDFSSTSSLNIVGDAAQVGDRIRLAPAVSVNKGAIWYAEGKQPVHAGFDTQFEFQILKDPAHSAADGFVFAVQNDSANALGGNGHHRGYDGIIETVGVEFANYDYYNSRSIIISKNHSTVASIGIGAGISDFTNGSVHEARILYEPGTLSVYIDDLTTPLLSTNIDLASSMLLDDGRAWVGMTAATGSDYQNHDILNWSFTSTPVPEPSTLLLATLGQLSLLGFRRKRKHRSSC